MTLGQGTSWAYFYNAPDNLNISSRPPSWIYDDVVILHLLMDFHGLNTILNFYIDWSGRFCTSFVYMHNWWRTTNQTYSHFMGRGRQYLWNKHIITHTSNSLTAMCNYQGDHCLVVRQQSLCCWHWTADVILSYDDILTASPTCHQYFLQISSMQLFVWWLHLN